MTYRKLLLFLLLIIPVELWSQKDALDGMLSDSLLKGTSFSICFEDVASGEIIFSFDAERNLAPASVMKLYPTSAALMLLGDDYRFSTEVGWVGSYNSRRGVLEGDIVIRGGGDPALGSALFAEHYGDVTGSWAEALAAAGLRRVTGRVAAAASCYDYQPTPPGWAWEDLGNYYGAGVYDINFNDNTYNIFLSGTGEGNRPVIDSVDKAGSNILITNYLISSGTDDEGYVFDAPYSQEAWLAGSIPANGITVLKASLPDPPQTVAFLLEDALRKRGVEINGKTSRKRLDVPSGKLSGTVITTLSPPLSEIVKTTNHESMNLYAEQLCKHLGLVVNGKPSFSEGITVIKSFLDTIGCNPFGAVILDASGLSSNNNISALMTVKLLRYMYLSREHDTFLASLPEGGVSGTMKNYFRGDVFKGKVRAKTGSMTSVRSFGGYVITNNGKTIAFTIIANGFTAPWRQVTNRMEKIVEEIILNY